MHWLLELRGSAQVLSHFLLFVFLSLLSVSLSLSFLTLPLSPPYLLLFFMYFYPLLLHIVFSHMSRKYLQGPFCHVRYIFTDPRNRTWTFFWRPSFGLPRMGFKYLIYKILETGRGTDLPGRNQFGFRDVMFRMPLNR